MARAFDDGSNQYLEVGSAPASGTPLTLAARFNTNDMATVGAIIGLQEAAGNDFLELRANGPEGALYISGYDGTNWPDLKDTSQSISVNTWHHGAAVLASDSVWKVITDGGSGTSDTKTYSPATFGMTRIGRGYYVSANQFSGFVAEPAIWSAALTDAEIAMLAAGLCPLLVRPSALVFYAPLLRTDQDLVGGYDMTPYNSPTWADHPPEVSWPVPAQGYWLAEEAEEAIRSRILVPKSWHAPIRQLRI